MNDENSRDDDLLDKKSCKLDSCPDIVDLWIDRFVPKNGRIGEDNLRDLKYDGIDDDHP